MNEAFEKILERLDEELRKSEERYYRYLDDSNLPCMFDKSDIEEKRVDTIKEMLEIVQEAAEEYNGGWIACSEKLPELRQDVLVTVKYTGFMGMHGYWIKTGHMEAENDWWGDCAGGEVIAWMELPSAYRPKEK